MSTVCVHKIISISYTAADANTDSGGLHITAHLLHTVQDTSGQWCVERVMERETLSNNTEYQEILKKAKIKGLPAGKHPRIVTREQLDYENRRQVCDHALLE